MENDIQRCRLSLGLLLADICLLVPVVIVAGLANSAFMGGTPNVSGFWTCMALAGGVLVVLNAAVELGLYWLRWLFCAVLAGLVVVTLGWSPSLSAAVEHDYVQPVEQSQSADGVTASVEYLIVDRKQVSIFLFVPAAGRRQNAVQAEPFPNQTYSCFLHNISYLFCNFL